MTSQRKHKGRQLLIGVGLMLLLTVWGCLTLQQPPPGDDEQPRVRAVVWPNEDPTSPEPHYVFGTPVYVEHDPDHDIERNYAGFTVYYDDRVLSPRWCAMKLTAAMADANSDFDRPGRFRTDPAVASAGLAVTHHDDYKNTSDAPRKWDRGHMIQLDDARGWGDQAGEDSMYTTNICPQLAGLNQQGWLALEQRMTEFARDYEECWIFVGPIFGPDPQPFAEGREVPSAEAFFRVAIRPERDGTATTIAFILPHEEIARSADLSPYVVSIDEVEARTGVDFFPLLPDDLEADVEAAVGTIWEDL
jgi:endonuclease G